MTKPSTDEPTTEAYVEWRDRMKEKLRVKDGEIQRLREQVTRLGGMVDNPRDVVDVGDEEETPFDGDPVDESPSYLEKG